MRQMILLLLTLSLGTLGAAPPLPSAINDKPVRVEGGLLSGVTGANDVTSYKGIPYAAPPVGNLRWRAPQPPAKWSGVRNASEFGASCMQDIGTRFGPFTDEFMTQGDVSEDCLFLNVWTPSKSPKERLPVMLWIHGGGFGGGSGNIPIYDGQHLAKKGVVVVTINYRVGPLGFLAYPELTAESANHSSGNYGILDQIAALQWVQRNIGVFGGDATRVTIFGQSAGAASVAMLMESPLAKGLFARAIAQSGPGLLPDYGRHKLSDGEQVGMKYAESKGAHSLAELRAMPASKFVPLGGPAGLGGPAPIADGWVVPQSVSSNPEVPVMVGMVANDVGVDGTRGIGDPVKVTTALYRDYAAKRYGARADAFLKLYPADSDDAAASAELSSSRDRARVSIFLWSNRKQKLSGSVYTYFFDRAIPWPAHPEYGAFHTAEVPYIFLNLNVLDRPWEPVDRETADAISSYWVNFAATGDPDGKGLKPWPAFKPSDPITMELGAKMGPMPIAGRDKIAFFTDYLTSGQ